MNTEPTQKLGGLGSEGEDQVLKKRANNEIFLNTSSLVSGIAFGSYCPNVPLYNRLSSFFLNYLVTVNKSLRTYKTTGVYICLCVLRVCIYHGCFCCLILNPVE